MPLRQIPVWLSSMRKKYAWSTGSNLSEGIRWSDTDHTRDPDGAWTGRCGAPPSILRRFKKETLVSDGESALLMVDIS